MGGDREPVCLGGYSVSGCLDLEKLKQQTLGTRCPPPLTILDKIMHEVHKHK